MSLHPKRPLLLLLLIAATSSITLGVEDATTNPAFQEEDLYEATTIPEEVPVETTTPKENQKMVINVVTSQPRQSVSVEASSGGKKIKNPRHRTKSTTSTTPSPTTTQAATTEAPTTTSASTTTSENPTTTTLAAPIQSKSSAVADEKENLVADASQRAASSFHGFEDSQAKLQTAESSQPARVNVRPAQNGKEYEYEYIYYYYDDDDENSTEKHAEPSVKAVGQNPDVIKQGSRSSTTLTPSTKASSTAAGSTTTTLTSTTTTTLRPQLSSDADFEYDDDAALEEEQLPEIPEIQKSTPAATRTTEAPISKGLTSAEKLSNSNPINQLDRSRGPKILQNEKFDDAAADYKLEAEASQEEEAHIRSKGQPLRQAATSSEEDEQTADAPEVDVSREPSTSAPASTSGLDISQMSTLAKTHKDSVNSPIVIKQSSLLKAVPVSQLQSQSELAPERPSTSPFTTPSTTTTTPTVEAASEVVPSIRPASPRLRGQRPRGNVTPRPSPASTPAPEQPADEKPQQSIRRPTLRDSPRRIQSRRPVKESPEEIPEQQPAASPIIETHARPLPIRPRFPPRTGNHVTTTAAAPAEAVVSEIPASAVTVSAAELNSLEDKRTKDTHVRAKSANDLYAFTRLQQAISSRAPGRVQPKLVAGFVNSAEVTTDAMTSSEVTTVSSFGGQSSETAGDDAPPTPSTTTTTTTTTTEAAQLDKFGKQRGRFGGRTRRPLGSGAAGASSTTTETPTTARGRFNGGRRRTSTPAPEADQQSSSAPSGQQTSSAPAAESSKPKLPSRNRFASRNRGSTTETPVTTVEGQKTSSSTSEVEKPSTPAVAQPARRRPGAFQGRRRPNQLQSQTETPAPAQEETSSASAASDTSPTTASATSTAAPTVQENPGRNRFNFAAGGGRARPSAATPGNNPVRIRGGGRLRGPTTTTTTTEAAPEETQPDEAQEQPADAEQSPTIQSENIEPAQNAPAPDTPVRGTGGVLGRLKSRPKLVVTTTTLAPEAHLDRKPSRLNGILNRRKNLGQLTQAAHIKEEVRETTSEHSEEADNHAQEQEDDDHKGVVVQISSSVTESEEVNEAAGEVVEPSSTTPGSILNRLKSQRKPGSLFRKKPDPHGE